MWFKSLVSYHTISMSNLKYAILHMLFYVAIKNEKSTEILNSCIFIAFNTLYRSNLRGNSEKYSTISHFQLGMEDRLNFNSVMLDLTYLDFS